MNQQTSVELSVSENGFYFPSHYVFSADELFVHVSINDNEVYLRFDNGWRMFFQSHLPLPVDVCHELMRDQKELRFVVYAD
ncbi:hypothetical protein [Bacillus sp. FJAT-26390]|uniref:hypothetical protein n=1 Tax=Bacillus sp. FJAT-26390 TaxID=1743142 RepID=UPI000807C276|nr:hypothetical protein [Bacillus sp. FJAT-26390]OBZ17098.1 hypothetical protein A7975_04210 [Bacillus sp. FJAT-26390]